MEAMARTSMRCVASAGMTLPGWWGSDYLSSNLSPGHLTTDHGTWLMAGWILTGTEQFKSHSLDREVTNFRQSSSCHNL